MSGTSGWQARCHVVYWLSCQGVDVEFDTRIEEHCLFNVVSRTSARLRNIRRSLEAWEASGHKSGSQVEHLSGIELLTGNVQCQEVRDRMFQWGTFPGVRYLLKGIQRLGLSLTGNVPDVKDYEMRKCSNSSRNIRDWIFDFNKREWNIAGWGFSRLGSNPATRGNW